MKQKPYRQKPEVRTDHHQHRLSEFKEINPLLEADRAALEKEYAKRLAIVQNALVLFCKKHDPHGLLMQSGVIMRIVNLEPKKDFAPYSLPEDFALELKTIIRLKPEETTGAVPFPSTGSVAEANRGLDAGNVPQNPLMRLSLFGQKKDVISLGEKSIRLFVADRIDTVQALAMELFCFKQTEADEKKLVFLLMMSQQTDRPLDKALRIYNSAIYNGDVPYFTSKMIQST